MEDAIQMAAEGLADDLWVAQCAGDLLHPCIGAALSRSYIETDEPLDRWTLWHAFTQQASDEMSTIRSGDQDAHRHGAVVWTGCRQ